MTVSRWYLTTTPRRLVPAITCIVNVKRALTLITIAEQLVVGDSGWGTRDEWGVCAWCTSWGRPAPLRCGLQPVGDSAAGRPGGRRRGLPASRGPRAAGRRQGGRAPRRPGVRRRRAGRRRRGGPGGGGPVCGRRDEGPVSGPCGRQWRRRRRRRRGRLGCKGVWTGPAGPGGQPNGAAGKGETSTVGAAGKGETSTSYRYNVPSDFNITAFRSVYRLIPCQ